MIVINILMVDGVCVIQSKLNVGVHEKPVVQISEKLFVKFQSHKDALNDYVHEEKATEGLATLLYDMPIKLEVSLTHLLQNIWKKIC